MANNYIPKNKKKSYTLVTGNTAIGAGLTGAGSAMTSFAQRVGKVATDYSISQEKKFRQEGPFADLNKIKNRKPNWNRGATRGEAMRWNTTRDVIRQSGKLAKFGKATNIVGMGMIAAEGVYKGTKRALGPGGTEFHTKKSKNKYGTKGY